MQRYALILGLEPNLSAGGQKKVLEKVKNLVSDLGGKVEESKSKGLTKLAYPIVGFTEASFNTIFLNIPGDGPKAHQPLAGKIQALQKELKLVKGILRLMVVREEVKK